MPSHSLSADAHLMIKCMHIYCFYQTGAIVKYTDLLEQGSSEAQVQAFLSDGEPTPITIRVPKNLKEAASEVARLRGVSFSAFVRNCLINELSGRQ